MKQRTRRLRMLVLSVAALVILVGSAAAQSAKPRVVTIAMTNAWDTMMPVNTNSNYGLLVYDQIYDRLVVTKADGSFAPRLAKSWSVNAASTAITFTLNEKATWHDGKPVTAHDVVFTAQLYSNPAVKALARYRLNYFAEPMTRAPNFPLVPSPSRPRATIRSPSLSRSPSSPIR